ncbi:MAG: hypothetical protein Q8R25_03620 [bacterium]|nr:hypothetical protein [bacterium]
MRLLITIFVLVASITTATAKDWNLMNGRERRSHIISYLKQHQLLCTRPTTSIAEQEAKLAQVPWSLVTIGLRMYCVQRAPQLRIVRQKQKVVPSTEIVSRQGKPSEATLPE